MPAKTPKVHARVLRNEDARLLTGRARFVDDVQLPGMLHVAFVRSDTRPRLGSGSGSSLCMALASWVSTSEIRSR